MQECKLGNATKLFESQHRARATATQRQLASCRVVQRIALRAAPPAHATHAAYTAMFCDHAAARIKYSPRQQRRRFTPPSAFEGFEEDARVVPAETEAVGQRHLDVHLRRQGLGHQPKLSAHTAEIHACLHRC